MSADDYLTKIDNYIHVFELEKEPKKRLKMVSIMERHIIDLNKMTQDILLDDQPIRFIMQKSWIEPRVKKVENLLKQLASDNQRNQWNDFLLQEMIKLTV